MEITGLRERLGLFEHDKNTIKRLKTTTKGKTSFFILKSKIFDFKDKINTGMVNKNSWRKM